MIVYGVEKLYPLTFREKIRDNRYGRLFIVACGKTYLVLIDDTEKKIYYASGLDSRCSEAVEKIRDIGRNIELYRDRIIYPRQG